MAPPSGSEVIVERIRMRYGWWIVAANLCGALTVFLLLVVVLPGPGIKHQNTVRLLSVIAFLVGGAVVFPVAWTWSARAFKVTLTWAAEVRPPTEAERDATLRFPLTQSRIVAVVWMIVSVGYAALTLPFSLELSSNVLETLLLGGLVTCALCFLIGERQL